MSFHANPPRNDFDWFRNAAAVRWQAGEQHIFNLWCYFGKRA
jgi:hypothetical protein